MVIAVLLHHCIFADASVMRHGPGGTAIVGNKALA